MHVPRPSFDQCVLAAAVVVHLFTAWSSTGFHVADEHYQVIAFAEAKLGHQPLEDLPWEYAERLRGTLLPVLCMAVFSLADGVGIGDPFLLAFFLRLLTAMVALWAMWRSAQCARHHLPAWCWRPFLLLSFFLWFLPFLQVRFTGETWSGIFLLMAMAPMLGAGTGNLPTYRIGLLLGLAFLCRPPTLAAAVGMVAWLVLVQRAPARRLFQLAVGFVAVWLLGIALDSWYYGQPTLTAWNYLHRGILGRSGSPFLAYPWWYYFPWVFKQALPLVGAAILLAFALLVAWRPRHLLTWTLVPFLLLHLAVPHKELRMLYPVAGLMPLLLAGAMWTIQTRWPIPLAPLRQGGLLRVAGFLVVASDLIALLVVATSPAGTGVAHLAGAIHRLYADEVVQITYQGDPAQVWRIRIPAFYLPEHATDTVVGKLCSPHATLPGKVHLIVTQAVVPACTGCADAHWRLITPALPAWKQWALRAYDWEDAQPAWKLYEARTAAHRTFTE